MYRVILQRLVLFICKINLHSLNDGRFYFPHKYIIFHKTLLNIMTIVEFSLPLLLFFLISGSVSCMMTIIAVPDNKHKSIAQ